MARTRRGYDVSPDTDRFCPVCRAEHQSDDCLIAEVHGVFPAGAVAQLRQTFQNIELTLAEGGASWANVVELTSYHVGLRQQSEAIVPAPPR